MSQGSFIEQQLRMFKRKGDSEDVERIRKRKRYDDTSDEEEEEDMIGRQLKLRGGSATVVPSSQDYDSTQHIVAKQVRNYLDVVFNSMVLAAIDAANTFHMIPDIVDAILKYNNVYFKDVYMIETKAVLFEPLWYYIDVKNFSLVLFLNKRNYYNATLQLPFRPVIYSSGYLDVKQFNPYEEYKVHQEWFENNKDTFIRLAVLCDRVAHLILREMDPRIPRSDNVTPSGTTFHSMFEITRIRSPEQRFNRNQGDIVSRVFSNSNNNDSNVELIERMFGVSP